ncbi:GNAT family N-acetyltransferase [Aquimarina sp. 2201CG14-23]|uniref:GNAT family N-acetyltransferase n=1 Tax=Aquimarina mycalae TaxID=3040073 RepID=UPI00247810C5|nr:GNAT family protein [Aquimarina sp. 2201CG14-23]MDH7447423.1 GNAT family protein [Aquimarina sp. 2201CG14-23]
MKDQEIKIRTLTSLDIPQLARLANNENIWNNLRDYIPYPYDENDAASFIDITKAQHPKQSFGIEFKNNLCGVISLIIQQDVYRKSAEIGYWIGEPYWGKGIATKAVELITAYGFDKLNLIRIYAGVFEHNIASMKTLEKNGYKKEGISQKALIKNDRILDEHRYYILNKNLT